MERIEGIIGNVGELYHWPPFFFHYIIACICVFYVICVCVLKFKYLFWYNQPITFQFTLRRFLRGGDGCMNTSVMNPLSLGKHYNNAVVYPFLHFVDHKNVIVYGGSNKSIIDAPYEKLAAFLSRREIELVAPTRRRCLLHGGEDGEDGEGGNYGSDIQYIPPDKFEYMLSQETHGLSVFIGVLADKTTDNIKGVCILTPRIMISFSGTKTDVPHQSVSIYVCEHLAWTNYITNERESLELLETTEYIQKSREIAGEQTLYRYREIPRFVIPFTTVYTYMFHGMRLSSLRSMSSLGNGITLVQISSANFALFYTFVNECMRDFRYSIFNELTQLQSLVQGGIYTIYMLLLNHMRVVAVYIFEPSWLKVRPTIKWNTKMKTKTNKTIGNRISSLHDHISRTSTAVVKYLPPVTRPIYDAFGKRVNRSTAATATATNDKIRRHSRNDERQDILLLKSSIRHKLLCDCDVFVRGFIAAASSIPSTSGISTDTIVVSIDTIAHNYQIIDALMTGTSSFHFLSKDKWYYILYNAIIHQEILCKDLLMI